MFNCRITIIKRSHDQDLIDRYLNDSYKNPVFGPCDMFKEGQTFLVTDPNKIPEGFCAWAWSDIHRELITLMSGGNLDWMKSSGSALSCCTDGFRPVIFLLERI